MSTRVTEHRARRTRRPGRRTIGLVSAFTACLCVAALTTTAWSVGRQTQYEHRAGAQAEATWNPGPRAMMDTASQADIHALHAQGWTVPVLAAEGYRVVDVRQAVSAGQPTVTVTLRNDHGTVEIVEQRGQVNPDNPVDGVSQLPVSAEGMHESALSGSRLWVERGEPWRAVMVRPDAVYTVTSDTPPATMAQTVSAVVAEDRGRVSLPSETDDSFGATVQDGLRVMFG
ncbi:hypothetical protein CYJ75_06350 [Kocuria rhizophila]|nr:hypothetical protein CYJ75_06350 [Kocuria rhizophila]